MTGKKINYYNVTKDGISIANRVTNRRAAEVSGCDPNQVSTYANGKSGGVYHGDKGDFAFEVNESVYTVPKSIMVKTNKLGVTQMTDEQIEDWEKYRFMINPEAKKREIIISTY